MSGGGFLLFLVAWVILNNNTSFKPPVYPAWRTMRPPRPKKRDENEKQT